MLRPLIALLALVTLSGCAAPQNVIPFSRAQAGDFVSTSKLSVVGVIDNNGIDLYLLFMTEGQRSGTNCIPLILDRRGKSLAKRLSGGRVIATGNAIPIDELNQAMPNQYGEINGRYWSGTTCTGRIAIYVTALKAVH
ncbi:MAG: hypothetical protein JHD10_09885 [Sphingomonadaceae bacterium]|jgi:hypothetical protein|nr:hypothetical protein [Sphingomonadaceae bacterium]